jgi:hypothetical protein
MIKKYVLWGTPTRASKYWSQEDQDRFGWQDERVITEQDDKAIIKQAMEWARENGFEKLRVMTMDGSIPNFTKGLNV